MTLPRKFDNYFEIKGVKPQNQGKRGTMQNKKHREERGE
ncbi:Hypothetical protein LOCK900_1887 [Lacticaseibacillus rhamnosus LOCK900]|nr:Hypothetical protein LOCK900_1887 [Lacticaseibacillus rhamnosus LOCK900]